MRRTQLAVRCCGLMLVVLLGTMVSPAQAVSKIGDYVEFGSYLNARILWRVMLLDGQNATLWSEYVLTAKCFDASESGVSGRGEDQAEQWGSNLWSRSNLREWLNAAGKVNWSTHPPNCGGNSGK